MFSIAAPSSSPHYDPFAPSPLSPRSTNIYGRRRHQQTHHQQPRIDPMATTNENKMPSAKPETTNTMFTFSAPPPPRREVSEQNLPFAQRRIKVAPPVARAGDLKERRRGQFLKKVERGREEERWEKRGDDILRMDFMQRQREWEAAQARSAASLALEESAYEEEQEDDAMDGGEDRMPETVDLPTFSSSGFGSQMQMSSQRRLASSAPRLQPQPSDQDEIERLLRDEDEELEMLLSYMPTEGDAQSQHKGGDDGDSLWSEDADYDALFSEVLNQEAQMQRAEKQQDESGDVEMDLS
ncbi:hypothetical protein TI39_contig5824g00019 [Zymoseptoria brevis]|uniref:Uncharacterized protein n=1 Tax=Zymoseptoria brevis TaxID=1047168 RepID=A0A0F4G632_9PEZI|nr:hypothetical protein TI39_contig5824g00019 [Zymoseptoria brevis]